MLISILLLRARSSIGLIRFNRLGSSFSSRTGMSSFSRYLVLWLVISALTVGICRSVCITVYDWDGRNILNHQES